MHLFSPEIGMMGTSGIVGPCILQACGGGYSSKILKNGTVGVAFFGDGAVNNGAFHEGLNMASIWKLPVLFICENNQFATEVPFAYASGNPSVGNRGSAYGIPGYEIDGNDVLEVYRVADAGFNDLDAPIRRLTGTFCPTPYSPSLESVVVPQASQIAQAIRDLVQE